MGAEQLIYTYRLKTFIMMPVIKLSYTCYRIKDISQFTFTRCFTLYSNPHYSRDPNRGLWVLLPEICVLSHILSLQQWRMFSWGWGGRNLRIFSRVVKLHWSGKQTPFSNIIEPLSSFVGTFNNTSMFGSWEWVRSSYIFRAYARAFENV